MKAEASTVSHRNPTASVSASVSGTPRTARLATASSHSTRVRIVEAANTTAYWRRKVGLVKSTCEVEVMASLSLSMMHAAASAQPLARVLSGSRAPATPEGSGTLPLPPPPSQYCLAGPEISPHGSLELLGVGDGDAGAADTWVASRMSPD